VTTTTAASSTSVVTTMRGSTVRHSIDQTSPLGAGC
jgi:hypothetical protein